MGKRKRLRTISNKGHLKGFTIVELLIVIVVAAILAALVVVAYDGIQVRAKATRIESAVSQYYKGLLSHAALNGSYPISNSSFCLGEVSDYPNGCYSGAAASTTVSNALRSAMGNLPSVDSSCKYMYGTSCRRNLTLFYQVDAKLDGKSHPYYLTYFMDGKQTCKANGGGLGGSWKNYSSTPSASGYFEQDASTGVTMCLIAMPDPADT